MVELEIKKQYEKFRLDVWHLDAEFYLGACRTANECIVNLVKTGRW